MASKIQCSVRERFINAAKIRSLFAGFRRAQSAVELALIAPVVMMLIVVGVQFAIIGVAALGLGQVNYQGARYAAVNPSSTQSQVQSYMLSVASPIIRANSGSYLTSSLNPAPPCTFGNQVTVAVTYDVGHLIMMPNPFFGIKFPTSLTNSNTAFCE
jgi:Flp pilus assembly protein TadG